VKVLYVNHTARMSGGERSLLAILGALPSGVEPLVACPEGLLAAAVRGLGIPVATVPGTDGSLKLHPWHTARALAELGAEAVAVRRLARRRGADLIHANSIRAGLAVCAGGGAPVVVSVRDCLPAGRASAISQSAIDRRAAMVLANSRFTERCFVRDGGRAPSRVLHSPVDLEQFEPGRLSREEARKRLGLAPDAAVLAVLAQITPWKNQKAAVTLVDRLRDRFPKVRLLLVGSAKFVSGATRYDNVAYTAELEALVGDRGLEDEVLFLGERSDVPEVLRALDVLLVPSWEEPFGRTVVEAMAMGVPVLATEVGGPAESLREGVDGFLLPPHEPELWVEPAARLLSDPELRDRMGAAGRSRARECFGTDVLALQLMEHYREVLGSPP
jgi:glycosyltransferase involved in cell wall biosynthesis